MNIGEANAAATLLEYAAGLSRPGVGPVTTERAVAAGRVLAERVRKAIYAGPLPEEVAAGIEAAAVTTGPDSVPRVAVGEVVYVGDGTACWNGWQICLTQHGGTVYLGAGAIRDLARFAAGCGLTDSQAGTTGGGA